MSIAASKLHRIALVGTHTPRRCGVATLTADLAEALAQALPRGEVVVAALNDPGHRYEYPSRVVEQIADADVGAYRRAAHALDELHVDCVSLQHENGLYGGPSGSHVLALMRELQAPIVTTLHTLSPAPTTVQRAVMDEITQLSARLVVMSEDGASLLRGVHGVDPSKIDVIPYGVPATPLPSDTKHELGLSGRSVILTYGLLSPSQGIELVVDAMPAILARDPTATYVVLGATHPQERIANGERYRELLAARARAAGVDSHVIFRDRHPSPVELARYVAAADVYVTPCLQPDAVSAGTLAYALGAGRAIVATPSPYARELLAEGRGVVVRSAEAPMLADAIQRLLADAPRRAQLGMRAAVHGSSMQWPVVARQYLASFARAAQSKGREQRVAARMAASWVDLPPLVLEHLDDMTDATGILKHASYDVPSYDEGYSLDDNARALLLTTWLEPDDDRLPSRGRVAREVRYLAFVAHALDRKSGRFRSSMSYARRFREEVGSEDAHGRAIWALGAVVLRGARPGSRRLACDLLLEALPATRALTSPRGWAYALLGLDAYLQAVDADAPARAARALLAQRLYDQLVQARAPEWPWFEDRLTYANARLPQALLVSGVALENEAYTSAALTALGWLAARQDDAGTFSPIGTEGYFVRGGARASFDQRPLEACGMVSACIDAERATGDARWRVIARAALAWFAGQNVLHQSLYDERSGGCRDGLHEDRVSENRGAEATLSFLLALAEARAAGRERPAPNRRSLPSSR